MARGPSDFHRCFPPPALTEESRLLPSPHGWAVAGNCRWAPAARAVRAEEPRQARAAALCRLRARRFPTENARKRRGGGGPRSLTALPPAGGGKEAGTGNRLRRRSRPLRRFPPRPHRLLPSLPPSLPHAPLPPPRARAGENVAQVLKRRRGRGRA